jgi:hypothetical protein
LGQPKLSDRDPDGQETQCRLPVPDPAKLPRTPFISSRDRIAGGEISVVNTFDRLGGMRKLFHSIPNPYLEGTFLSDRQKTRE